MQIPFVSARSSLEGFVTITLVPVCQVTIAVAAVSPSVSTAHSWRFEAATDGWQPRAKSVAVGRLAGTEATPGSQGSLRVQGRLDGGWSYTASGQVPLQGGALHRLSAWLRLDRLGADTPAPFLKCEFIGPAENRYLGQVTTTHYERDWWRQTARDAQCLSLPRRAWTRGNCIVDIADCPRGHWCFRRPPEATPPAQPPAPRSNAWR